MIWDAPTAYFGGWMSYPMQDFTDAEYNAIPVPPTLALLAFARRSGSPAQTCVSDSSAFNVHMRARAMAILR